MGGGGYDIWRVVPRAWALIWIEMTETQTVMEIYHRTGWIMKEKAPVTLSWDYPEDMYKPIPRKAEITEKNLLTLEKALYPIRSQQKSESRYKSGSARLATYGLERSD